MSSAATAADIKIALLREIADDQKVLIQEVRKSNALKAYEIQMSKEAKMLTSGRDCSILDAILRGTEDADASVTTAKKTTTKKGKAAAKAAEAPSDDVPSPAKSTTSEGSADTKTKRSTTLKMLENTYRLSFRAKYLKTFKVKLEDVTKGMDKEDKKKAQHEAIEPHFQTFWKTHQTKMRKIDDKYHEDPFSLDDKQKHDLLDSFFEEHNDELVPANAGAGKDE